MSRPRLRPREGGSWRRGSGWPDRAGFKVLGELEGSARAGRGVSPSSRPSPSPARLAVFKTHVASDFPFEGCVIIILLYFRPGSYNNTNNKLHFMEHLSFQRITKCFRDLNSSYKIK